MTALQIETAILKKEQDMMKEEGNIALKLLNKATANQSPLQNNPLPSGDIGRRINIGV